MAHDPKDRDTLRLLTTAELPIVVLSEEDDDPVDPEGETQPGPPMH